METTKISARILIDDEAAQEMPRKQLGSDSTGPFIYLLF